LGKELPVSAEPEEVEEFIRQGSSLAVKMASSATGAILGAAIAGPPGAILGSLASPVLEHHLSRAVGEFVTRRLGDRQRVRAAAGSVLLAANLQSRLSGGQSLRDDGFDQTDEMGCRPFDEVTEQAILDMMNSVEERRLPYLANFYSSLYFESDIPRASIATFVSIVSSLNYRAMCILSIVGQSLIRTGRERADGEPGVWSNLDHMVAKEVFNLVNASVLVNKADDAAHYAATLGYTEVEPGTLQLGPIGQMVYEKMALSTMLIDSPDIVETQESLQRIALSPSGGPNFVEQFERALKPFEKQFDLADWSASGAEFVITVPISEHRNAGNPVAQIEAAKEGGGYQKVGVDVSTDDEGTLQIRANQPFVGRVTIP
jgi:hypothetical protein